MNEITITNETSKSVTINIEGDKIEKSVILKSALIEYVVDSGMNMIEIFEPIDFVMDQMYLDPLTYLNDNLLDVVKEYYHAN